MKQPENGLTLKDVFKTINKKYGEDAVAFAADNKDMEIEVWDTNCFSLNHVLGNGGLAKGRVYEFFGEPSCIAESSRVNFEIRKMDGTSVNSKGGTIKQLYNRFHNIRTGTHGEHLRTDEDVAFTVASKREDGSIFQNPIADVVKSGLKPCFEVCTKTGKRLVCTAEHKLLTANDEYVELQNLEVGSRVYVRSNTPRVKMDDLVGQTRREELCVKFHPNKPKKLIEKKYTYYRVPKSHLVFEAHENGMTYEAFVELLNSPDAASKKDLYFIPAKMHIHHKNGDHKDNRVENLQLVTAKEHGDIHGQDEKRWPKFYAVEDVISSITPLGEFETYDIKCFAPYNNFLADGIVVHNSGKTTAALFLVAQIQKAGGKAAFLDAEFSFNLDHAKKIGVNTEELIFAQPNSGEEAFDLIEKLVHTGEVSIIVVDSTAALVPSRELEGAIEDSNVALQARMISKGLRMITGIVAKTKTIVIFISQVRSKIGSFAGPSSESSGGNALKFYASVRLDVRKIKGIKDDDKVIGNRLKIVATKNKVAAPFGEAEVDLYFTSGFDLYGEALDYGEVIGAVVRSGNSYIFEGEKIGVGREASKLYLMANSDVYEKLKSAIQRAEESKKDEPKPSAPETESSDEGIDEAKTGEASTKERAKKGGKA